MQNQNFSKIYMLFENGGGFTASKTTVKKLLFKETEDDKQPTPGDQSYLRKILRQKLVTTQHELEVQQRDPNSPLYSVRSFEELNLRQDLLKGFYLQYLN